MSLTGIVLGGVQSLPVNINLEGVAFVSLSINEAVVAFAGQYQ